MRELVSTSIQRETFSLLPKLKTYLTKLPGYDHKLHTPFDLEDAYHIWLSLSQGDSCDLSDLAIEFGDSFIRTNFFEFLKKSQPEIVDLCESDFKPLFPMNYRCASGKELVVLILTKLFERISHER
jgi:hypothetical protein